jgi:hypothetical protein
MDRKRPRFSVFCGPVRSLTNLERRQTGLGLGPCLRGPKDRTGPNLQTLVVIVVVMVVVVGCGGSGGSG